jgi:hypothetical protein
MIASTCWRTFEIISPIVYPNDRIASHASEDFFEIRCRVSDRMTDKYGDGK